MATDKFSPPSNNPMENILLLAKRTPEGSSTEWLIRKAIGTQGLHVFGELLDMPNVKELENGPHSKALATLNLFAYGTYKDYISNKTNYVELSPSEIKKLQHLTIVTLATKMKCIPYSTLLQELDLHNVRDLEDLIIEAIYADIIRGKLDQKNSQVEVDYAIGRDIKTADLGTIVATLQEWCSSCETVLSAVETQIHVANGHKNKALRHRDEIEVEINNIKKTLQSQTQGMEEAMMADSREAIAQGDKLKKSARAKMLKGSTKFWHK